MNITKRQLRKILKEDRASRRENPRNELRDFKITMTIRVPAGAVEYVLSSIEDGMEFDEDVGEGILHWDVQEVPYEG
jgi:hypothetical protein